MIFCSNISVSFDFFVPPVPAYIQRNTFQTDFTTLNNFIFKLIYSYVCVPVAFFIFKEKKKLK
ncbi:hypothetical protein BpHYR1_002891 [Brachionus plicatilis]|uniref:Uncharacterized protein n=1 Tax=Brachionus plicatilis TaxID=10195 RepID=A0A3M7Q992_BRAPC|nr:hypothetical protein BpHYR1_002891 [Brachionus plicatilis]